MDDLITCDVCHKGQPRSGRCVQCNYNLLTESPVTRVDAPRRPAVTSPEEDPRICRAPRCGTALPPHATECPYCGTPTPTEQDTTKEVSSRASVTTLAVRLIFPWGERSLATGETLVIGRDPDASPLADELAAFDTVSRRHAVLRMECDGLHVEHVATTNETYVNGSMCKAAIVHPGDRIRFSTALEVVVESEC